MKNFCCLFLHLVSDYILYSENIKRKEKKGKDDTQICGSVFNFLHLICRTTANFTVFKWLLSTQIWKANVSDVFPLLTTVEFLDSRA